MKVLTTLTLLATVLLTACSSNPTATARSVDEYYANDQLRVDTLKACVAHSLAELEVNSRKPACANARLAERRHEDEREAAYEEEFNRSLREEMAARRRKG